MPCVKMPSFRKFVKCISLSYAFQTPFDSLRKIQGVQEARREHDTTRTAASNLGQFWKRCERETANADSINAPRPVAIRSDSEGRGEQVSVEGEACARNGENERGIHKIAECDICCERCDEVADGEHRSMTSQCRHVRSVCRECVGRYIKEEIVEKGNVDRIRCIEAGCSAILSISDIQRWASRKDFSLFEGVFLRHFSYNSAEFCWCSNSRCGSGQLHGGMRKEPLMICHACGAKTCFVHRTEWHEGRTCAQMDKDIKNKRTAEGAFERSLKRRGIKQCPKCKQGVQRIDGCDQVRVRRVRCVYIS